MKPAERRTITLTVQNRGSETWSEAKGGGAPTSGAHAGCAVAVRSTTSGLVFPFMLLVSVVAIFRDRKKPPV